LMMVGHLRQFYAAEGFGEHLGVILLRRIQDPLKPQNERGILRVNPLLVLLTFLAALASGTFLLFSVVWQ